MISSGGGQKQRFIRPRGRVSERTRDIIPMTGSVLPWANRAAPVQEAGSVPSLTSLALDTLAMHAEGLTSIRGVDIHLCTGLLYRIMQRGALDYRLACVFRDCGHADIAEAVRSLNLYAAIPTHNTIPKR